MGECVKRFFKINKTDQEKGSVILYSHETYVVLSECIDHGAFFIVIGQKEESNMTQFLTVNQAAGMLNISRPTINRKLKTGEIPCVRIGKRVLVPEEFFKQLNDKAMGRSQNKAG